MSAKERVQYYAMGYQVDMDLDTDNVANLEDELLMNSLADHIIRPHG